MIAKSQQNRIELVTRPDSNFERINFRLVEAAYVAGEDEIQLNSSGKTFTLNLSSLHEIREDSGTARPIQRKLTSQLQIAQASGEAASRSGH